MVTSEKPDIILLDMSLPIKDGWTAATEIKANQEVNTIPIIALTAHAMSEDREKALAAGCDEYDTKPVDFKRLLALINKLLEAS
jgi:two-component system response regulator